jgi:hypothetical protein
MFTNHAKRWEFSERPPYDTRFSTASELVAYVSRAGLWARAVASSATSGHRHCDQVLIAPGRHENRTKCACSAVWAWILKIVRQWTGAAGTNQRGTRSCAGRFFIFFLAPPVCSRSVASLCSLPQIFAIPPPGPDGRLGNSLQGADAVFVRPRRSACRFC